MQKHFIVLLIGSVFFALLFLWHTLLMPHFGAEGAVMVFAIAVRNALRVIFLYAAFVILVFGHFTFEGKTKI